MAFSQLLELVSSVLSFVWTQVFCSIDALAPVMGTAWQSAPVRLSKTLVNTLHTLIPKTETDLQTFQRAHEKACQEFDVRLDSINSATLEKLSDIVTNIHTHFGAARRRDLLARCRDLIMADYHNTMLASGDALEDETSSAGLVGDPSALLEQSSSFALQMLRFEPCQISLAACRVLKLVHEIMKQACSSSPEMATLFYEISRDCLELYLAVVPTHFANIIVPVTQSHSASGNAATGSQAHMGAIFYNDCVYIAHNTTLLTHTYRHTLEQQINDKLIGCVGFVDYIHRCRCVGECVLGAHMDAQIQILLAQVADIHVFTEVGASKTTTASLAHTLVAQSQAQQSQTQTQPRSVFQFGMDALTTVLNVNSPLQQQSNATTTPTNPGASTTHKVAELSSNTEYNDKKAANVLVQHFEWLRSQWQGVLQDATYERVMAHLVEVVIRALMKPVLESECITERAGLDVSAVFRIIQQIKSVVGKSDSIALPSAIGASGGGGAASSGGVCVSWSKFCALADILEYNLSEVGEWLPRRKFASFTVSELVSLIKALFDDSVKREAIILKIQEMAC